MPEQRGRLVRPGGPILSAEAMRAAEAKAIATGTSAATLMERAGQAIADLVWRIGANTPVLVLAGPGNNGGDGYVVARLLKQRGVPVRVAALASPAAQPAAMMANQWHGPTEHLSHDTPGAPIVLDSLFGTGLTRPLDDALVATLGRLVSTSRLSIAVDVPSYLSADLDFPAVGPRYTHTIALGALKPAHMLLPSRDDCGQLWLADIAIPATSTINMARIPTVRIPDSRDHKYTRGMVLIVGGAMPGASLLAARAAQRSGAGYVRLISDHDACHSAAPSISISPTSALDDMLDDPRVGAVVVGPGVGRDLAAQQMVDRCLQSNKPLALDADALHLLDGRQLTDRMVLTPHGGEFTALGGERAKTKIIATQRLAAALGATVLHKGSDTVIAAPDGRAAVSPPASRWLSTAGTGDVLAGIAGAMLARNLSPFDAAQAAALLLAKSARHAVPGFRPEDLLAQPIWP